MLVDDKDNEEICNEVINSNLSDKAKIKAIQALKGKEDIKENKDEEMVICEDNNA